MGNLASVLAITDSEIYGNSGGGIYNEGTATIAGSEIHHNSATGGGGIYNLGMGSEPGSGTLTISNCSIHHNNASSGGGIESVGYITAITIKDSRIEHNNAIYAPDPSKAYGGGIYVDALSAAMHTTNATVCFNTPDDCMEESSPVFIPCKVPLNPCSASNQTYFCGPNYQCEAVPPGIPPGPYNLKQCEDACHPPAAHRPAAL